MLLSCGRGPGCGCVLIASTRCPFQLHSLSCNWAVFGQLANVNRLPLLLIGNIIHQYSQDGSTAVTVTASSIAVSVTTAPLVIVNSGSLCFFIICILTGHFLNFIRTSILNSSVLGLLMIKNIYAVNQTSLTVNILIDCKFDKSVHLNVKSQVLQHFEVITDIGSGSTTL